MLGKAFCRGEGFCVPLLWNNDPDGNFCPYAGADTRGNSNPKPKGGFFFSFGGGLEDDPASLPTKRGTEGGTIVPKVGAAGVTGLSWGVDPAGVAITLASCMGFCGELVSRPSVDPAHSS